MARTFEDYQRGYAAMWQQCKLDPATEQNTLRIARVLIQQSTMEHYNAAAEATGVPAGLIAAINYRESGGRFDTYLGNGDPLDRVTTHEPSGRGPFTTWQDGAQDALRPFMRPSDGKWSIEFALYFAENYNGRGYEAHHENSPYIWSQTVLEQQGMFTSDHGYDPTALDHRPGVAALFRAYEQVAPALVLPSIAQTKEAPVAETQPVTKPDPLAPIVSILTEIQSALPMFGGFIPQPFRAVVMIGIPVLEEILSLIEKGQQSGVDHNDLAAFFETIAAHMHAASATLKQPQA